MKSIKLLTMLFILPCLVNCQEVFELKFTAGITQYRAALVLFDDGTGAMRVKFYDNGPRMVEQYVRLENTLSGLRITGYNPVYPGTSTRHPSYQADNFYISQDENGNLSLMNVDDGGVYARSYIRSISGYANKTKFLGEFDWKQ